MVRDAIIGARFADLGDIWSTFWPRLLREHQIELQLHSTVDILEKMDRALYDSVIHILIPDVLQFTSAIKTKNIRTFAKQAESWMRASLHGYDSQMIEAKARAASDFGQRLRRYTGLNHLAQASRGVMQSQPSVESMLADYERVDFQTILDQISWLHNCDFDTILKTEEGFREFLKQPHSVNDWTQFMQLALHSFLGKFESDEHFKSRAGEFLIRWSFVSSLIIRDITLRSASSFGIFHLIRLFCDEYMFFLVELTIEHGKCVTVTHEQYAPDGLSDSHSSFQLHDGFEADIENEEFDFGDSADMGLAGYKHSADDSMDAVREKRF